MPDKSATSDRYWPRRYTVVALCFFSTFICYLDRVNISVAIIPMARHFGWGDVEKGLVLSSFFIGYIITQVLGGWLANRFGGKLILGFAVLWWSLFTILTPMAAFVSMTVLLFVRIGMGVGEGVAFPATYNVLSRWVPAGEKARAASFNLSGLSFGTITALTVSPWIVSALGWPAVFYISGAVGFVWFFFWWQKVSDTPDDHPTISEAERRHIRGTVAVSKPPPIPWALLLSRPQVWAIIINHFCNNWALYVLITWLPSYFADALGVQLKSVWIYIGPPWICQFLMGNAAGWCADGLFKRGFSTTFVRKLMQTISLLGTAVALLILTQVGSAPAAVLVLCVATGLGAFGFAGFASNHLDIAPRYADILFGLSNTAATVPGIVGVALTGWLVETTGSYASAFVVTAGICLFGLAVWLIFATGEKIVE
jgi:ACS family sodium-dependent inorganic phosphate cotransporter